MHTYVYNIPCSGLNNLKIPKLMYPYRCRYPWARKIRFDLAAQNNKKPAGWHSTIARHLQELGICMSFCTCSKVNSSFGLASQASSYRTKYEISVYACIYEHVSVYVCACMNVYMPVCMGACVRVCVCVCVCVRARVCVLCVCVCTSLNASMHVCICTCVYENNTYNFISNKNEIQDGGIRSLRYIWKELNFLLGQLVGRHPTREGSPIKT